VAGNPMTATGTALDFTASNLPVTTILQTGATNTGTLPGSAGLDGTVLGYGALSASGSITVEFWARTIEGTATLARYANNDGATSNGWDIDSPNDMQFSYRVGGSTVVIDSNINLDAAWRHIAWTYDEATGIGSVYEDGTLVAFNDGADGVGLDWTGIATNLRIGDGLDTAAPNGGIDEFRISDVALMSSQFLNSLVIPEPSTAVLLGMGLVGLASRRSRRRRVC